LEPGGRFRLHPQDAAELQVKDGDEVRVESPSGAVSGPAGLDRRVPRRTVQAALHFEDLPVNRLTDGGILCAVRVARTEAEPGAK
jgi:anaerobic selenocysteine-containing dehydrogenase